MSRVVYGLRPVEELLRSNREVAVLYFAGGGERSAPLKSIAEAASRRKIAIEELGRDALLALAGGGLHQGVIAIAGDYTYIEPEELLSLPLSKGETPLILVLDSVQDPQNLGALVRSAHVLGAHGVLIPKDRAAQVTPSVVKASAGATEHVPIALCTNLARALEGLKSSGVWVVGAVSEGGEDPWAIDFKVATALVLGAEGTGLRPLVAKSCDRRVKIPMVGQVASLNVSAAGAVLLYEATRQRLAPRE